MYRRGTLGVGCLDWNAVSIGKWLTGTSPVQSEIEPRFDRGIRTDRIGRSCATLHLVPSQTDHNRLFGPIRSTTVPRRTWGDPTPPKRLRCEDGPSHNCRVVLAKTWACTTAAWKGTAKTLCKVRASTWDTTRAHRPKDGGLYIGECTSSLGGQELTACPWAQVSKH